MQDLEIEVGKTHLYFHMLFHHMKINLQSCSEIYKIVEGTPIPKEDVASIIEKTFIYSKIA